MERVLTFAVLVVAAATAAAPSAAHGRPFWVTDGVQTLRSYFRSNPQPRTVGWGIRNHERWVTVVFPTLETCVMSRCLDGPAPINGPVARRPVTGRRATITWYSGGTRIMSVSIKKN